MNGPDQGINMSALTVGEANLKDDVPRAVMWLLAVCLPSAFIATSLAMAYILYIDPHVTIVSLWHLLPIILCGVYVALVLAMVMYLNLYLPHAPVAVREALIEVGLVWIGVPLMSIAVIVASFGPIWMVATMVCLVVVVIFGTIAFLVYLVRTYRK